MFLIANFCLCTGVDEVDYNLYPKREHQLKWIATYLEEAAKLRGNIIEFSSEMVSVGFKQENFNGYLKCEVIVS